MKSGMLGALSISSHCLEGTIPLDSPVWKTETGFSNIENWVLQPDVIRLQHWVQDFNPDKVCTSLAQVWVRLLDLPMEYWQLSILEAMASAMRSLIRIDDLTAHCLMGHYVRLLVEVDMRNELIEKIMYKRAGVYSFANITYERLLDFCRGCGIVGHTTVTCSRGRRPDRKELK
ncbi:hypothetical protein ACS0TY_031993 [Phlomoides rotata]